jgi:Multiubiquitin
MPDAVQKGRPDTKVYDIIVNGRPKEVEEKEASFEEVAALAFGAGDAGPLICYTMTYRRGQGSKPEGTLLEGQSVKIKDGMIFNVGRTDKS